MITIDYLLITTTICFEFMSTGERNHVDDDDDDDDEDVGERDRERR